MGKVKNKVKENKNLKKRKRLKEIIFNLGNKYIVKKLIKKSKIMIIDLLLKKSIL